MKNMNRRTARIAALATCAGIVLMLSFTVGRMQSSSAAASDPVPAGHFRLDIKRLVADATVVVTQVNIEKQGAGQVRVKGEGFTDTVTFDATAQQNAGASKATLMIVADLITTKTKERAFKLLIQTNGNSGPQTWHDESAAKVSDIFDVSLQPGVHLLGTSVTLGTLKGKPVILTVN